MANYTQEVRTVTFVERGDDRGVLVAIEELSEVCPFEIKRCYYIYDTTPGTVRGKHAHKNLEQLLICVSGSCVIRCDKGNGDVQDYTLDWPNQGLYISGLVWHDMLHFSKGAVLMVLVSRKYDEADYVRERAEFESLVETFK